MKLVMEFLPLYKLISILKYFKYFCCTIRCSKQVYL